MIVLLAETAVLMTDSILQTYLYARFVFLLDDPVIRAFAIGFDLCDSQFSPNCFGIGSYALDRTVTGPDIDLGGKHCSRVGSRQYNPFLQ